MKKFYVGVKGLVHDAERGFLLLKSVEGFWDIPGGRIDGVETFEEALKRELSEELPNTRFKALGELQGSHRLLKDIVDDISLVLIYFLVEADIPEKVALSDEHDAYIWVKKRADIPAENLNSQMREILERLVTK